MNPIELEWQQLKNYELSGQMFDDELDLASAVIDGVEARGEKGNYTTQRFKFNSNPCSLFPVPSEIYTTDYSDSSDNAMFITTILSSYYFDL